MGAEIVAGSIAIALHVAKVKYKFRGEGTTFGTKATLIWDSIVVEAVHPVTLEYHRLHTLQDVTDFLEGLKNASRA